MLEFKFTLCLALGLKHPDELDNTLSDIQLAQWQWYYQRYPFGHWIDNFMRARICSSMLAEHKDEMQLMPKLAAEQTSLDDDELIHVLPGGSGALKFLETIKNGDRQNIRHPAASADGAVDSRSQSR